MSANTITTGTLITKDKCNITYCHYQANHDKVIIIAHGFYNSKDAVLLERLAIDLLDEYDVFMFDFRGHGKSSGLFSWMSKEENDLLAALDYLWGKYNKTGLIAFSLGGSVGINVLSYDRRVNSFVCVSAPSDFHKIDYHFWLLSVKDDLMYTLFSKEGRKGKGVRPGPFWLKKNKPLDKVKEVKAPILYIHGKKDWVIRPWHSKVLYERTNYLKKIKMIEGGPHGEYLMKDHKDEFISEIKDWFKQTLKNPACFARG